MSTNYWTFVGDWAGNATMNVTGSGSYTSGALNGNGNILVGLYGSTGVLNVNTTGTLTASGLYVSPNNTTNGGALPNSGGTFNLAAGTVNISGDTQIGSDFWGAGNYSNGQMTMTGGTMNVGGLFDVGHLGMSATSGTSSATISGGTLNVQNDLRLGFAGNTGTAASMIINGGAVNVATTTARWVILGQWDPTSSSMEVSNGGSLNLNAGTDIMFGISGNSGTRTLTVDGGAINGTAGGGTYIDMQRGTTAGTSTITIKNGGTVAVDAIVGGAVSTLNFDGGTLKATSSDANLINISGAGTTNLLAGGGTIDTNGLNLTEGGTRIIDDASLSLAAGRTVVLGPNGAGKSTLLRLIHGLLHPSTGILYWPRPLSQAMVFQRPIMLRTTALANVVYGLTLKGHARTDCEQRARQALARVGLEALVRRPARLLSGGEQQRVALARVWALEPELLILDEPTASLDPASSREVERIISEIAASGTRILMTTHNLGQARRLAEELVFIDRGRIAEQTPVAKFFNLPQSEAAQDFLQEETP